MNIAYRDAVASFVAGIITRVELYDEDEQTLVSLDVPEGAFIKSGPGQVLIPSPISIDALLTGDPVIATAYGADGEEWSFEVGGPGSNAPMIVQNDQVPPTKTLYGGKSVTITDWRIQMPA